MREYIGTWKIDGKDSRTIKAAGEINMVASKATAIAATKAALKACLTPNKQGTWSVAYMAKDGNSMHLVDCGLMGKGI